MIRILILAAILGSWCTAASQTPMEIFAGQWEGTGFTKNRNNSPETMKTEISYLAEKWIVKNTFGGKTHINSYNFEDFKSDRMFFNGILDLGGDPKQFQGYCTVKTCTYIFNVNGIIGTVVETLISDNQLKRVSHAAQGDASDIFFISEVILNRVEPM